MPVNVGAGAAKAARTRLKKSFEDLNNINRNI